MKLFVRSGVLFLCVFTLSSPPIKAAEPVAPAEAKTNFTPLFDGKTLEGWIQVPADSWIVKDGAMVSTGAARGVIYTKGDSVALNYPL